MRMRLCVYGCVRACVHNVCVVCFFLHFSKS
uniref:Uncharacterized protein n=1 Tax=Anguilla anguilla TaxID=7936 RepID=A0A0E9QZ20_ANGAN